MVLDNAWITVLVERVILFSWLVKDFGWMTTDVYLGFPFGFVSFALHVYLVFFDHRASFRFYNVSLLCWVSGNCLWMITEFFDSRASSDIHMGPHIPLKGISERDIDHITNVKIVLFASGIAVQLLMYGLIWSNMLALPRDDDEDIVMINEASRIFCSHRAPEYWSDMHIETDGMEDDRYNSTDNTSFEHDVRLKHVSGSDVFAVQRQAKYVLAEHHIDNSRAPLSLAYIENTYIIFWITKDLFWSFGTGDPEVDARKLTGVYEAVAMLAGALALLSYIITAYLFRRDIMALMDCLTTLSWITANYLWMCGEFFIRYDNMELDDIDQGNDERTRIASTAFFCIGIFIQLLVIYSLTLGRVRIVRRDIRTMSLDDSVPSYQRISDRGDLVTADSESRSKLHHYAHVIEMFSIPSTVQYERFLVTFTPQEHRIGSADDTNDSEIDNINAVAMDRNRDAARLEGLADPKGNDV